MYCKRPEARLRLLHLLAALTLALSLGAARSEPEASGISVGRMKFCRAIKDREPEQAADRFPSDIEKVYCFTVILNAGVETHVVHKWYHREKLMAEVTLTARGEYWRTWSSKRMLPEWSGAWRVDVVSADGQVLKSLSFEIVAAGAEGAASGFQETSQDGGDGGGAAAGMSRGLESWFGSLPGVPLGLITYII